MPKAKATSTDKKPKDSPETNATVTQEDKAETEFLQEDHGPSDEEAVVGEIDTETEEETPEQDETTQEPEEAPLTASELRALRDHVDRLSTEVSSRDAHIRLLTNNQEITDTRYALQLQGIEDAEVERRLQNLKDTQQERGRLAQERQSVQSSGEQQRTEFNAKIKVAQKFIKDFGGVVGFDKLMEANTPEQMENICLKAQLSAQKKAKLTPNAPASNRQSTSPSGSLDALKKRYAAGGHLSDAELAGVFAKT